MAKEELIEMHGSVTEVLPDGRYRVTLDNGHNLIAYSGGKMRKHRIRVLAGDRVSLELSPYDLNKGRLTFRHIERRQAIACMMMLHWNDCNRSCCSENWNFHWRISEKF